MVRPVEVDDLGRYGTIDTDRAAASPPAVLALQRYQHRTPFGWPTSGHLGDPGPPDPRPPVQVVTLPTSRSPLTGRVVPAVLTALLLAVFLDLWLGGPLAALDMWALRFRIALFSPLRPYGNVLDASGLRAVTAPALVGLALWLRRRTDRWRPLALTLIALLALNVLVGAMKIAVGRGNPLSEVPDLFEGGVMWPSGHASNVSMTWTMVVYLLRNYDNRRIGRAAGIAIVAGPSAFMTVVSLVLGYHWLSDLIAGTIVGLLIAAAVIRLDGGNPWLTALNGHAAGEPSPLSTVRPLLLAPVAHLRPAPVRAPATGDDPPRHRRSA